MPDLDDQQASFSRNVAIIALSNGASLGLWGHVNAWGQHDGRWRLNCWSVAPSRGRPDSGETAGVRSDLSRWGWCRFFASASSFSRKNLPQRWSWLRGGRRCDPHGSPAAAPRRSTAGVRERPGRLIIVGAVGDRLRGCRISARSSSICAVVAAVSSSALLNDPTSVAVTYRQADTGDINATQRRGPCR